MGEGIQPISAPQAWAPPAKPAPIFATTQSATANAALASIDTTIAPFREALPTEKGAPAVVGAVIGAAVGAFNAPAAFIDATVSTGISAVLNASPLLKAMFPAFPIAQLGLTMHMGTPHIHPHPPSTTPPVPPIPLPSMGIALCAGSASVLICGMPALRAGDVGLGITCGSFAPPFEVITGAASVYVGGARVARIGIDLTRHCNPVKPIGALAKGLGVAGLVAGAAGLAAGGNPAATRAKAMQMALDTAAFAMSMLCGKDPSGPPGMGMLIPLGAVTTVMAGGPPIPNVGAWAQGHLYAAIGKALRSLKDKFKRSSPSADCNGKAGDGGEPVSMVTGENYNSYVDFRSFHGAFRWTRHATSARSHESGRLGYCFRHVFEARLEVKLHRVTFHGHQGERIEFPRLKAGQTDSLVSGYRLTRFSDTQFRVSERRLGSLDFERENNGATHARLTAVQNEHGRVQLVYRRDGVLAEARETSISSQATAAYTFYHDSGGRLIEIHGANLVPAISGAPPAVIKLVSYAYDGDGQLLVAEDAYGAQDRYEWDRWHRITKATDRANYSFRWEYAQDGKCTLATGQDGLWFSKFEYDTAKRKTRMTVHDGSSRYVEYDEDGVVTKLTDASGGVLQRLRAEDGTVISEVDAVGRETKLAYDAHGAHTHRVDRFGHQQPPQLDQPKVSNPFRPSLPRNPHDRLFGDGKRQDPLGSASDLAASIPHELSSTFQALFQLEDTPTQPTQRDFDVYGRPLREVYADGTAKYWRYDGVGNLVLTQDRDGRAYQRRMTSWNLVGERIDPLGNTVRYTYNAHEKITSIVDPLGGRSDYDYDADERIVRVRRNGRVREEYTHDLGDRLVEKRDTDGRPLLKRAPHENGLIGRVELLSGDVYELDYDAQGKVTKASTKAHEVIQEWDRSRRLILARCDDREINHVYGVTQRHRTWIAGKFQIRYDCAELGERSQPGKDPRRLFVYGPNGFVWFIERWGAGLVRVRHGASNTAACELQQYNAQGKLRSRMVYRDQGAADLAVWSTAYRYSTEGDLLEIRDTERGKRTFEVDAAHRLIAEQTASGENVAYPLDEAGNLLSKPGLLLPKVATGNKLLHANSDTFSYDGRDNLVERQTGQQVPVRYEHDSFDRLVTVHDASATPWTASYDALGRRISAGRAERQRVFWWDDDRLAAETAPNGSFRIYVYADERALVPIGFVDYDSVEAAPETGRAYSVFSDQIGLPLSVEDASGGVVWWAERVDPYGAIDVRKDSVVEYNLRWPGHYFDPETGLHYNRFRYYDPVLGRYLESDPIGCAGGVNLYAYSPNPLVQVDLLGLHNEDKNPTDEDGSPAGEKADGDEGAHPPLHDDHYPPRTAAAQEEAAKVAATLDGIRPNPDKNPVVAVMVHEDGTVSVGISGESGSEKTAATAAALQKELNGGTMEGPYRVSGEAVPGMEKQTGGNSPGNCAEPKAAAAAGDNPSPVTGMDVRRRGGGEHNYPFQGTNADGAPVHPSQMEPCPTCGHPENVQRTMAVANSGKDP